MNGYSVLKGHSTKNVPCDFAFEKVKTKAGRSFSKLLKFVGGKMGGGGAPPHDLGKRQHVQQRKHAFSESATATIPTSR
jgi:hypothetical protein